MDHNAITRRSPNTLNIQYQSSGHVFQKTFNGRFQNGEMGMGFFSHSNIPNLKERERKKNTRARESANISGTYNHLHLQKFNQNLTRRTKAG